MLDVPPPDHHFPMPPERLERFAAALLTQLGQRLEGARVIGEGYVSTAYLLADGVTVARVPKFDGAVPDLELELGVLPVLEAAGLPLATPRDARALRDEQGLAAGLHHFVPGRSLKPHLEQLRSSGEWRDLAHDFGRFLSALHAIPIERFEGLGADRWSGLLGRWVEDARPALGERGSAWLDSRLARLDELARPDSVPDVFTHGDFWPSNILVDESGRIAGVIDLGLSVITDPAWDLRAFESLMGPAFLDAVLETYDCPLDEHAPERAKILLELDELGDVAYELTVMGRPGQSLEAVRRSIAEWDGAG